MNKIKVLSILLIVGLVLALSSCGSDKKEIVIAVTEQPHKGIIEESVVPALEDAGYEVKIEVFDDYTLFNKALENGEINANFFQHQPYLDSEIDANGYDLKSIANVHVEPLAGYSYNIKTVDELKKGDVIAIPNDESNASRALLLLQKNGIIKLENKPEGIYTVNDITENSKGVEIKEFDANTVAAQLNDPKVKLGVINSNYAIGAQLNPVEDSIILESLEGNPYANIVVVKTDDADSEWAKIIKESITSKESGEYIDTLNKDGVYKAF